MSRLPSPSQPQVERAALLLAPEVGGYEVDGLATPIRQTARVSAFAQLSSRVRFRKWAIVRVGDYGIVYEVRDRELLVLVLWVAHRRDVYRR